MSAMMSAALILWVCVVLIVYVWLGYPSLLWLLAGRTRRREDPAVKRDDGSAPSVAVVVAAHNEEAVLARKLENCLALSYPESQLEVVVASDGSTDRTVGIASEFARRSKRVRVYVAEARRGKTAVQNAVVQGSTAGIIVFSDVDTEFDPYFLAHITRPFEDPGVGCVTGALLWTNSADSAIVAGGDRYWQYEHFLWRLESRLNLLAWASGACIAVRRELFKPIDPQFGEDCVVPLDVVLQGSRVVFEPAAVAYETRIAEAGAELRARTRMTLRSFAGTLSRKQLLNPLRFPAIAWAIISHKLLRWLTPYLLLLLFVSNLVLIDRPFYRFMLGLQILFYAGGAIGWVFDRFRLHVPALSTIYAFCLMNLGVAVGVAKAVLGHRMLVYKSEG